MGAHLVFRLDGDNRWLHQRPASRAVWAEHVSRRLPARACASSSALMLRLRVCIRRCGASSGALSQGMVLVSSNNEILASYGHQADGGAARVCVEAAFVYPRPSRLFHRILRGIGYGLWKNHNMLGLSCVDYNAAA